MATSNALYRFVFTITTTDPDHAIIQDWCKENAQNYCFQREVGTVAGKSHFQGRVKMKKKVRKAQLLKALEPLYETSLVYVRGEQAKENMGNFYVTKEETRVAGPWSDQMIYAGRDLACMSTPYPWQKQVLDSIAGEADDRTVNFIVDPVGNSGKSKLAKYIGFKKLGMSLAFGDARSLANLVIKMKPKPAYFLDLSRSKPKDNAMSDIYNVIEQIKNGYVLNTKYEPEIMYMEPPHVWVLSNLPPVLDALSADRWVIWEMDREAKTLKKFVAESNSPKSNLA